MKIRLYKCKCRVNDVNKLNSPQTTLVKEVEAEVYGDFYMSNASFKLSDRWASNYCSWRDDKLGITFCGWTTVSTNANGLFTYHIQEDILEMAWIDGCFDTTALCVRSTVGTKWLYDGAVPTEENITRIKYDNTTPFHQNYVLVSVLEIPATRETTGSVKTLTFTGDSYTYQKVPPDQSSGAGYTTVRPYSASDPVEGTTGSVTVRDRALNSTYLYPCSPVSGHYLMSAKQFGIFYANLLKLTDEEQTKYAPSITGVYMIPYDELPHDNKYWDKNISEVTLYYINKSTTKQQITIGCADGDNKAWKFSYNMSGLTSQDNIYELPLREINFTTPFEASEDRIGADIFCRFSNGAIFNINTSSLEASNRTISKIGYVNVFNPEGKMFRHYLKVNNTVYPDQYQDMPFTNLLTLCYDSSVSRNTDYLGGALSIIGGLAMVATGVGGAVAAGSAASKAALGALTVGNMDTQWGALKTAGPAAFRSSLGANALGMSSGLQQAAAGAGSISQTTAAHSTGSYSTLGGQGWSVQQAENMKSQVIISYYKQPELHSFQAIYGKPDNRMRNISTLKGYVLTSGARLVSKTGNMSIGVRAVDEALNGSGVFIL